MKISVLLVDRDRRSRAAIAAALAERDIEIVAEAVSGDEALDLVDAKRPMVALVDVHTLGDEAAEVARNMRSRSGYTLSIIAMAEGEHADRVSELVAAGARAYVVKDDRGEIVDAVVAVSRGSGMLSPAVTRPVLEEVARLYERERVRNDELEDLVHQLQALSVTDWLTGLKNHGYFYARLVEELDRSLRHRRPLAVIFADIDDFKSVNDTFGHQAGDSVLQVVGNVLSEEVRSADIVCRIGGEEFGVLLPETDGPGAHLVAERMRERIAATPVEQVGRFTISMGIASVPDHAVSRDELVEAADRALYLAKREGKNRTRIAGELVPLGRPIGAMRPQGGHVVDLLVRVLRLRDPLLANHALRSAEVAVALGAELELKTGDLEHLRVAALLQDVGKIGVPDAILYKSDRLTDAEWAVVKDHPKKGFELVQNLVHPVVAETVLNNHERYDGTGYPNRLMGEAIPILARVLLVADAYVAMTGGRTYRDAMSPRRAVAEIERNSGTQFDPSVVAVMRSLIGALEGAAEAMDHDMVEMRVDLAG